MMKRTLTAAIFAAFSLNVYAQAPAGKSIKVQSSWPASLTIQDHLRILSRARREAHRRLAEDRGPRRRADRAAVRGARRHRQEGDRRLAFDLVLLGRQERRRGAVLRASGRALRHGSHGLPRLALRRRRPRHVARVLPEGPQARPHRVAGASVEPAGLRLVQEAAQVGRRLQGHEVPPDRVSTPRSTPSSASAVVNMPGGEIVPAAQRGVIDCAEWVGGIEDLRLGLPRRIQVPLHPGHAREQLDRRVRPAQRRVEGRSTRSSRRRFNLGINDAFITWNTRWQRQNADAIEEMIKKHGVQVRRTPPDILIASLKAWDEVAAEHSAKNPTFKKVYESQREYASKVVPAKRYMHPPYSFAANYYWPQEGAPARQGCRESQIASENETLRWPTNLGREGIETRLSQVREARAREGPRQHRRAVREPAHHGRVASRRPRGRGAHLAAGQARAPGAHHSARDGGAQPEEACAPETTLRS